MLFICAFMGNVTYSVSIFLFSRRKTFILGKLPWIIGSAGVLCMDFFILMQFLLFKVILKTEGKYEEEQSALLNQDDNNYKIDQQYTPDDGNRIN
jgi:hypothetical protein